MKSSVVVLAICCVAVSGLIYPITKEKKELTLRYQIVKDFLALSKFALDFQNN